jgi:hypothetical protein
MRLRLSQRYLLDEFFIDSSLPGELIYPLLQRSNNYALPIVKLGERVLKGQMIASGIAADIRFTFRGINNQRMYVLFGA